VLNGSCSPDSVDVRLGVALQPPMGYTCFSKGRTHDKGVRNMREYRYQPSNLEAYENQINEGLVDRAVTWCVHIRLDDEGQAKEAVALLHDVRANSLDEDITSLLTGEYFVTDWEEWGEDIEEGKPVSLCLYFYPGGSQYRDRLNVYWRNVRQQAIGIYEFVVGTPPTENDYAISTAGDHAEQI
jgi:hypothetical protein